MSKFSKSNATIDTTKLKPTRGNWKVHNEINKSWIKYLWKNGNVCPVDLISKNAKEVLKFLCARLGLPLHVEEDVGLGLAHGLLVGQGYSTVIEVEPAALVRRVRRVMAWANAVGAGRGTTVRDTHTSLRHLLLGLGDCQQPEEGRYSQPSAADASLFELWGSKFSKLKFYKNTLSCPYYCCSQQICPGLGKVKRLPVTLLQNMPSSPSLGCSCSNHAHTL